MVALSEKLSQGVKHGLAPGVTSSEDIEKIIQLVLCPTNPILEKLNCLEVYRGWSKGRDIGSTAADSREACNDYLESRSESRYSNALNQYKLDLLAQILRSSGFPQKYLGLNSFVSMSWGVPRNLFIVLKNIYSWSDFRGEKPFNGGIISEEAQVAGVSESAEWFFEDSRSFGRNGHRIQVGVNRLATLLRAIRFSDKPSECSPSSFSCDFSSISEVAASLIKEAERWSLLIYAGRRRHKNSSRMYEHFQINRMLAPKWDLPLARRGVVELSHEEVESIFVEPEGELFNLVLEKRCGRMKAPWFDGKQEGGLDLFTNADQ